MKALIDGDILRYEVGFGAEMGWKAITGRDEIPPWSYVRGLLHRRIRTILRKTGSRRFTLYLTDGPTFRDKIAKTKPYKGHRKDDKPWHYKNLTVHMIDTLRAVVCHNIEADDALAMEHLYDEGECTILCSRDKDLRQIPGWFYSWEIGKQPEFGPELIGELGSIALSDNRKKVEATGFLSFCAQLLTGDPTDNIPGLEGVGPVAAYDIMEGYEDRMADLQPLSIRQAKRCALAQVEREYQTRLGLGWEEYMLEQGRLLWMVRRLKPDGSPELWSLGQME